MPLQYLKHGRAAILLILAVGAAIFLFRHFAPSPAEAAFSRGEQLALIRMDPEARAAFEEATRLDPGYAPPYRALAEMAGRHGAFDVAASFWRSYVARDPRAKHAYCALA